MFDLVNLVKTAGYAGITGIIFAETGLFAGFFLPGDSLLFTAGFLASQGFLSITELLVLIVLAAFCGDNTGYWFGRKIGPRIFNKEDSLLFHKEHLIRTQAFFDRHGGKAVILARFVPIVRTFTPIMAGVGKMQYAVFISYSLIATTIWGIGIPLAGYYLGATVPGIDKYILPIIAVIILTSVAPVIMHIMKDPASRERIKRAIHL
jgi:membrane-associated protein